MVRSLTVAALLLGAFGGGLVRAQDAPKQDAEKVELPTPPDGWWENVKGGESATYNMSQMGMQMVMTMTVDKVEGAKVTFTTTLQMGEQGMPPKTETIDFADPAQREKVKGKMPKDATVKNLGEETVNTAGRDWKCTVYEIEGTERGQKMKMKLWHSTELLPVFSNGTVKMDIDMMGPGGQPMKVELLLTEVKGPGEGGATPPPATEAGPGKGQ